jgi:WD40 repeat protein/tRNA A-37 threonylcarbamoyl transferase component Bud32
MNEESLFVAALDLVSAAERRAFLDEACAGDARLRQRVEQLLAADEQARGILDRGQNAAALMGAYRPEPPLAADQLFAGRFRLRRKLGEGSMGEVWLADQAEPVRRRVALKVVRPGLGSDRLLARFGQERQALALMDHANIARVFDAGVECGRPFFVMELIEGVPITRYCEGAGLPPRERLELFLPVCHAIQHAHQKGIIHRDLKPSNILVGLYDGLPVPKVIDFGIAKATGPCLSEQDAATEVGTLVGTLEYMSPEQAELNNLDVDTRSDVYSLGVLLYELLTGTVPFARERLRAAPFPEVLRIIKEVEPARPSTRLSDADTLPGAAARQAQPRQRAALVKGELDWIVMKCLEKDPGRRYQTANELALDLRRYLADEPVLAGPPSAGYRLLKFLRRNRGPVLAVSLVLLALVGGIIGTTWGMIRATAAQGVAVNEATQKEAALQASRQSERDARDQLFLALWNQARAGRFSRQPGQRLDSLAALAEAARLRPDERLRDEAIAAMALPDVRRVPGPRSAPPGTAAVAYGGQYRLYAYPDPQGVLSVRSIPDDREVRRIASGPIPGEYLFFSPDERFLLGLGEGYTLRVWRVADGQPALRDELRGCRAHAFSPDGRQLAVGREEWALCFDLATGQEVKRWRLPATAHALAFHPDGSKLAVGYFRARVVSVYDAVSGALLTDLPVGAMSEHVVAWHPDGERLAVAGSNPRIQIWNVAAKRLLATLEGHVQQVTTLTFHPDGELLASHAWDGQLLLWHPATGRQLMRLTSASAPQFSGDGRWLGVAREGDKGDLLEVTPTREYRTLVSSVGAGRGGYGYYGDISPDGRLLVAGMNEGARLWDLSSGRELAALPAGTPFAFFDGGAGGGAPVPPDGPGWGLLTGGSAGVLRWPLTGDDPAGNRLRLGPPRHLSPLGRVWFTRRPDGGTLGAATQESGTNQVLDLETGVVRQTLGSHPSGEVHALSADGRWAASSGWHSDRVRLWNAVTGERVHEWVVGKQTFVFFTPDSRTLVMSRGDEFSFWDVETLQPIRRLPRDVTPFPGWVAFSPDGKLMALEMAPGVFHLDEVTTGRTVARLEDPWGDRPTWHGFTPDGTRLVVVSNYASAVHVWDLRAIRTRLKDMNLDWDWPAFPPAPAGTAPAPLTVEVLPGDLANTAPTREQRARQDIERYRRQVEANPDAAQACNDLAWTYLEAPEALRDVTAALPLAEKAVRLAPSVGVYRNTLGVAYYRAGRYREAVEVLRADVEVQEDWALPFDLYFLAMSHHRLGEAARARDYYDWAVRWVSTQRDLTPDRLDELAACRAEAKALLGIEPNKD